MSADDDAVWSSDDEPPDSVTTVQPTTTLDGGVFAETLNGSEWVLVNGIGPVGEIIPVAGFPITLTFDGDLVGGSGHGGGCGSNTPSRSREALACR